jgi:hypothetical protein
MVAAFMSLEQHEGGIHAVCADTATLESLYHQSPQHVENTKASAITPRRLAHDQLEPRAPSENNMNAASTP